MHLFLEREGVHLLWFRRGRYICGTNRLFWYASLASFPSSLPRALPRSRLRTRGKQQPAPRSRNVVIAESILENTGFATYALLHFIAILETFAGASNTFYDL